MVEPSHLRPIAGGNPGSSLKGGGGDGTYDSMETRVAVLETHMAYVRADLSEIKSTQKDTDRAIRDLSNVAAKIPGQINESELKISNQLKDLPTKSDLKNYNLQMIAIGIAVLILVIGGIIGGLDWIKTR